MTQTVFYKDRVIHEFTSAPCASLIEAYGDSAIQFLKMNFKYETIFWLEDALDEIHRAIYQPATLLEGHYTSARVKAWLEYLVEEEN